MKHSAELLLLLGKAAPDITPASIAVVSGSGQSANCGAAYSLPLVAIVKNAGGAPLSGIAVTFTAPASGASGTFASTGTRTETVVTNAAGQATSSAFTATYPANGTYNVLASVDALSCSFTLTNVIVYLFRDLFTTDALAPLTTPRAAEPGPGTLTITDTNNRMSIVSSKLVINGAMAFNDGYITGALVRTAGRAIFYRFGTITATGLSRYGWNNALASSLKMGVIADSATILEAVTGGGTATLPAFASLTAICIIEFSAGGVLYALLGGTWTLLWRYITDTTTPMSAMHWFTNSFAPNLQVDSLYVADLPAPFDTTFGLATLHTAAPVSGTSYTGVANGIFDLTVTAPAVLANTAELRFRVQNATNYWTAYFAADGSFNVDTVASGTPTSRIAVAGVIAGGETKTIRILANGALVDAYTLASSTWTKRGSQINQNYLTTQTTTQSVLGAGWSGANLDAWSRIDAAWDVELNKY